MEQSTINTTHVKKINRKPIRLLSLSHKIHKWLALLIGAQFIIWSITGAYMVFFDIDYIHGDSLIINHQNKIQPEHLTYSSKALFRQYPQAENLSVGLLIDREVYRFNVNSQKYIVDATNGDLLSPLNKNKALALAKHAYSGRGELISAELITADPPFELSARHLPAWRINFDDFGSPALYISANSGKIVTKRHEFWRLFDWMFRLHVMDYDDGENVSNWLLFIFALLAIFATCSGLVLSYYKAIKPIIRQRKKAIKSSKYIGENNTLSMDDKS
ncbi:PepSY domain-containing protein [Cognaticolwellia aestuarii]|uniref:PepSY domain-containing protein n=1 Tax=Cognaticolwellia aestuarii TaxID=329993 RepID=UPI0039A26C31